VVVGSLLKAGFSAQMALRAFFTLDSYIYGFAVQEQNMPSGTPEQLAGMAETILSGLPADTYPSLRTVIVDHVLQAGFDYAEEFAFGLDLIIESLERLRGT
jgi:hypothetical protein